MAIHDPNDVLDYPFDWQGGDNPFLAPGVEIAEVTHAIFTDDEPRIPSDDLIVVSEDNDETTSQARVAVVTAAPGTSYWLTGHCVGTDGQAKDYSVKIKIKEQ